MGKSFILKDRTGTPAGYLLQGIQTLRCRFSGAEEGMEAILLYADGKHSARQIIASAGETEWEESGGPIEGVVMIKGDAIVAASDAQARRIFENIQNRARVRKKQEDAALSVGKPREPQAYIPIDEGEEKPEKQEKERNCGLPQRRWPRQPCWQEAVYVQGMWTERC